MLKKPKIVIFRSSWSLRYLIHCFSITIIIDDLVLALVTSSVVIHLTFLSRRMYFSDSEIGTKLFRVEYIAQTIFLLLFNIVLTHSDYFNALTFNFREEENAF